MKSEGRLSKRELTEYQKYYYWFIEQSQIQPNEELSARAKTNREYYPGDK